ncbi:hypothetical protein ACTD5D_20480 [Nocardia takedensis]|uniref:hypothetical protein n=1 Tax=Nocardia takedensis TaxID=259390 RepID=UPI003F7737A0
MIGIGQHHYLVAQDASGRTYHLWQVEPIGDRWHARSGIGTTDDPAGIMSALRQLHRTQVIDIAYDTQRQRSRSAIAPTETQSSTHTDTPSTSGTATTARIVIAHTLQGTLVHGTSRTDLDLHQILLKHGFKFSKRIGPDGAWYLNRTWKHHTRSRRVQGLEVDLTRNEVSFRTQRTEYDPAAESSSDASGVAGPPPEPDRSSQPVQTIEQARDRATYRFEYVWRPITNPPQFARPPSVYLYEELDDMITRAERAGWRLTDDRSALPRRFTLRLRAKPPAKRHEFELVWTKVPGERRYRFQQDQSVSIGGEDVAEQIPARLGAVLSALNHRLPAPDAASAQHNQISDQIIDSAVAAAFDDEGLDQFLDYPTALFHDTVAARARHVITEHIRAQQTNAERNEDAPRIAVCRALLVDHLVLDDTALVVGEIRWRTAHLDSIGVDLPRSTIAVDTPTPPPNLRVLRDHERAAHRALVESDLSSPSEGSTPAQRARQYFTARVARLSAELEHSSPRAGRSRERIIAELAEIEALTAGFDAEQDRPITAATTTAIEAPNDGPEAADRLSAPVTPPRSTARPHPDNPSPARHSSDNPATAREQTRPVATAAPKALAPSDATEIAERARKSGWRVHEGPADPDRARDYFRLELEATTVRGHRRFTLRWRLTGGRPSFDRTRSLAAHLAEAGDDEGRRPTLDQVGIEVGFTAADITVLPSAAHDPTVAPVLATADVEALLGGRSAAPVPQSLATALAVEHATWSALTGGIDDEDWRAVLDTRRLFTEARIARLITELALDSQVWPRAGDREARLGELDRAREDYGAGLHELTGLDEADKQRLIAEIASVGLPHNNDPHHRGPEGLRALAHAELDALAAVRAAPDPENRSALIALQIRYSEARIAHLLAMADTPDHDNPLSDQHDAELRRTLADLGAQRAAERASWRTRDLVTSSGSIARSGDTDPRAILDALDRAIWSIADHPTAAGETRARLELDLFRLRVPDTERLDLLGQIDAFIRARALPARAPAHNEPTVTVPAIEGHSDEPTEERSREEAARLEGRIFQAAQSARPLVEIASSNNTYDQYLGVALDRARDVITSVLDDEFGTEPGWSPPDSWSQVAGRETLPALVQRVADAVWRTHNPVLENAESVGIEVIDELAPAWPEPAEPDRVAAMDLLTEYLTTTGTLARMSRTGDPEFYRTFAIPAATEIMRRWTAEQSTDTSAPGTENGIEDDVQRLREAVSVLVASEPSPVAIARSLALSVWQQVTGSELTGEVTDGLNGAFESFGGIADEYIDEDEDLRSAFEIWSVRRFFIVALPKPGSGVYEVLAFADPDEVPPGGEGDALDLTAGSASQIMDVIRAFQCEDAMEAAAEVGPRLEPPEASFVAEEASARGWRTKGDFRQLHPTDRRYELRIDSPQEMAVPVHYRLRFDLKGPFGPYVYNAARSSHTIGEVKTLGPSLDEVYAHIAPGRTRPPTPARSARAGDASADPAVASGSRSAVSDAHPAGTAPIELSALDRAIINVVTDDYASLFKGRGGAQAVAAYVADVAMRHLAPGRSLAAVEKVARARINERGSEIRMATQTQVAQRRRERAAHAERLRNVDAISAYRSGDFSRALLVIDQAELIDPLWIDDSGAGYDRLRNTILDAQAAALARDADEEVITYTAAAISHEERSDRPATSGTVDSIARNWVHPGIVTVPSGKRARARANMLAIELLARLDSEDRPADAEEAPQLAAWSGWGAVSDIFDSRKSDWNSDRDRLRGLLDPAAYEAAADSTLNSHYTDPSIAARIWAALQDAGFDGGRVLEPGGGSGTFVGLAPADAEMIVVENEPISAKLIHRLYPQALVRLEGFQHTHLPPCSVVATVGNVPFGNWEERDPTYNPRGHNVHNAFIIKSLHLTAPGGYVAVISSAWTMDAKDGLARADMLAEADFIGAVRLPGTAFTRVAGTPVVTDIIVLRKREAQPDGVEAPPQPADVLARNAEFLHSIDRDFIDTVTGENTKLAINSWFTSNPQHVLGEISAGQGMYRGGMLNVTHEDPTLLPGQVDDALRAIVRTAKGQQLGLTARSADLAELAQPQSGLLVRDPDQLLSHPIGMVRHREDAGFETATEYGTWEPVKVFKTRANETRQLLHLRDLAHQLTSTQRENGDARERAQARSRLNRAYDNYVSRYGPVNRFSWQEGRERSQAEHDKRYTDLEIKWRKKHSDDDDRAYTGALPAEVVEDIDEKAWTAAPRSKRRPHLEGAIGRDPTMASVLALEHFDERTGTALKSAIFSKDLVSAPRQITSTDNPAEALSISLGTGRGVDLHYIAELLGVDSESARKRLHGKVFNDPDAPDKLIPAPKYLSGDVRAKLTRARTAAVLDPAFAENAAALEAVLPPWREAARIKVRPGSAWIPVEDHTEFARQTFGLEEVKASRLSGIVRFESESKATAQERNWGTEDRSALELFEALCNSRQISVNHSKQQLADGAPLIDTKATAKAQAQADRIRAEFRRWLWADGQRRERLVNLFNTTLNCMVEPRHDGRSLIVPGLSSEITPYRYQLDGAARGINEPTTQLDHVVGAGKTGTMLMIAWLLRQYGLRNQPWLVVPNHIVEDVVEFSKTWFPTSIALSAPPGMDAAERRRFVAQTATSDWDFVIVAESTFERIGVKPARRARYINEQLATVDAKLEEADSGDDVPNRSVKDLVRAKKQLATRLEKLTEGAKDTGLTLEDSGMDYLLIDEFHRYKNKGRFSPVPEASLSPGSGRAENIAIALALLRDRAAAEALTRGRAPAIETMRIATAATGTRIANALVEEWVHQQYLRPDLLEERGIADVTDWVSVFTSLKSVVATNVSGTSVTAIEKIASYANLPQMLALTRVYTDVVTRSQVPAKLPALHGGERRVVAFDPSQEIKDFIADLDDRISELDPDKTWQDNPLKVLSDGRNAALDALLVGLDSELANTRAFNVAREMLTIYHANKDNRYRSVNGEPHPVPGALQIGFCDRGTPTGVAKDRSLYVTLKKLLVAGLPELGLDGMPENKIAFIHDFAKPSAKRQLSEDCKNGHISVLLGSTEKMGTGMNIQTRAIAEHHIDVPWRPDELEQREGRIIRQHNQNELVHILVYVAEGTIDAFMWSKVQLKAEFIEQARTGRADLDEIEQFDEGDIAQAAALTKAIATGDPRHVAIAELEQVVIRLGNLEEAHSDSVHRARTRIATLPSEIRQIKRLTDAATPHLAAAAAWGLNPGMISVGGQTYDDRGKANRALLTAARHAFFEADAAYKRNGITTGTRPIAIIDGHTVNATLDPVYNVLHFQIGDLPVSARIERENLFPQVKTADNNDPDKKNAAKPPNDADTARGLSARISNAYTKLDKKVIELRADLEQKDSELEYSRNIIGSTYEHADELVTAKVELTKLRLEVNAAQNSPEAVAARHARGERLLAKGRLPGWSRFLNPTEETVRRSSFATRDQYIAAARADMAERAALYAQDPDLLPVGNNDPSAQSPPPLPPATNIVIDAVAPDADPPPAPDSAAPKSNLAPAPTKAAANRDPAERRRSMARQPVPSATHGPRP